MSRSFGTSVLISNKFFAVAGGDIKQSASSGVSDLDIAQIPKFLTENSFEETGDHQVAVEWVPSISGNSAVTTSKGTIFTPAVKFFLVLFMILVFLFLCLYAAIAISKPKVKNGEKGNRFYRFFVLPEVLWHRRAGESFTTQLTRFISLVISITVLFGFIYFFVYGVIHSSVSSTEENVEKALVTFPDIRFCYTGWPVALAPTPGCTNTNAPSANVGCASIVKLENSIYVPSFAEQYDDVSCYMYKSADDSSAMVPHSSSMLRFSYEGQLTDNRQRVHIQFYEPGKNPNRVLYLNETVNGLDAYSMDEWLDQEIVSGSKNNTINKMVSLYLDSTVYIQFKTTTTKKIDPNNVWNYVGIYPKYIIKTDLTVTHTDVLQRKTYFTPADTAGSFRGNAFISPADFMETTITEKRDSTIISVLGSIGGIVSILLAAQAILYGTKPSAPWGIIQKLTVGSKNQESKKRNLYKYFFVPGAEGLPLETPVHPRFNEIYSLHDEELQKKNHGNNKQQKEDIDETIALHGSNNFALSKLMYDKESSDSDDNDEEKSFQQRLSELEARNQILELVLKTYYIDETIFKELRALKEEKEEELSLRKKDSKKSALLRKRKDSMFN